MKAVIGLGNPGIHYRFTRHNLGFLVIERLLESSLVKIVAKRKKDQMEFWEAQVGEEVVKIARPLVFMNESGQAIGPFVRFFKISPQNLLLVYDDLDLPFGCFRFRKQGSSGGHKGMASVIAVLSEEVPRLRIGIGRPPAGLSAEEYVLSQFLPSEKTKLSSVLDEAVKIILEWIQKGNNGNPTS